MMDATFAGTAGKDYVHFNSIQVLPDGNWLCSFRHISSVIKIDRAGGTGNILWRIAGAELDEACRFHGQHYARLEGNNLTLFDNGNGHTPQVTKMLKINVNPETGVVTGGVNLIGGSYYSQACGSLTFSGNNFIVGWGMPGDATECNRIVTEHDAAGNEVFGIRLMDNNIQQNSLRCSYRCVKI